jgi:hypothetical protein
MEEYDEDRKSKEKEKTVNGTKVRKKILISMKFLILIRKGPPSGRRKCTAALCIMNKQIHT